MDTTVSSKGQITLPPFMRQALGLVPGSRVSVSLEGNELRLRPAAAGTARCVAGSLQRYARPGTAKAVRAHVKREVARAASASAPA